MVMRTILECEQKYSYNHNECLSQKYGCIGYLRGDFGNKGKEFFVTWNDRCIVYKSIEFEKKLSIIVNSLRYDRRYGNLLKDLKSMRSYCYKHPESRFEGNYCYEYGFRIDTAKHICFLRCNPNLGDYAFYMYVYLADYPKEGD